MRVTTDFWVSALVRRVFAANGFAAVSRKGAAEAGTVLLVRRDRLGDAWLYVPAAQADYDEDRPTERLFAQVLQTQDEDEIQARIAREVRFDSDLWIVELELDEAQLRELVSLTTP